MLLSNSASLVQSKYRLYNREPAGAQSITGHDDLATVQFHDRLDKRKSDTESP